MSNAIPAWELCLFVLHHLLFVSRRIFLIKRDNLYMIYNIVICALVVILLFIMTAYSGCGSQHSCCYYSWWPSLGWSQLCLLLLVLGEGPSQPLCGVLGGLAQILLGTKPWELRNWIRIVDKLLINISLVVLCTVLVFITYVTGFFFNLLAFQACSPMTAPLIAGMAQGVIILQFIF